MIDYGRFVVQQLRVTEEQWQAALKRSNGEPMKALEMLNRTPAVWAPKVDPTMAISEYQFLTIVRHQGDEAALARKLVWDDYLILGELGQGGMGMVYKGWDVTAGRYAAIKVASKDNPQTAQRLEREGRLLARLDHPHLARFYSSGTHDGKPYLALEYVDGVNLYRMLSDRKFDPIPWRTVARWGVELLSALEVAHSAGVIHRDIKASNVMLKGEATAYSAKLLDLGLGKALDWGADGGVAVAGPELTRRFEILGTFEYMAPEQWGGGSEARRESDLYGLGITLYLAVSGKLPFTGPGPQQFWYQHTNNPPPELVGVSPVPPRLEAVVRRMLAKEPAERGTAGELRRELQRVISDALTAPPPLPPSPPVPIAPAPEARSRHAAAAPAPVTKKVASTSPRLAVPPPPPPPAFIDLQLAPRPAVMSTVQVIRTAIDLGKAWVRHLSGQKDPRVSVTRFERTSKMDIERLTIALRAGVVGRVKMLARPHRSWIEWLCIFIVLAMVTKLFRVW
ncbi:MAG: serine/threonine protein kinase [Fimbriiglobus sp.]|jgi:serine/threonine protein kinase|nr:serine/threonine protein kinase [Fimbriiglobus sp.]